MSDNSKYHTVGAIVDQFLIDNDLPDQFFQKALSWALWGLTQLRLNVTQEIKTCLLEVSDRKTAQLPRDFVDWTKVGVQKGQYVVALSVNESLAINKRSSGDSHIVPSWFNNLPSGLNVESYSGYYFFNHNGNSMFAYDLGLPTKNHFKIVEQNGCWVLLMDYDFPVNENVYVEYISDGFNPCGETVVSPYLRDYILKYIDYRYECKTNPNRTEGSIRRMGADLYHAESVVRASVNGIDKDSFIASSRKGIKLTPKI